MKVKDLIEQLSKFDPETEVLGMCTDPTDFTYKVPIKSIEFDSPYDENGYSGVDGSEIDDLTIDEYDEEIGEETYFEPYDDNFNYVGPKVVLLNLGDV
jgi:hypothetical protein